MIILHYWKMVFLFLCMLVIMKKVQFYIFNVKSEGIISVLIGDYYKYLTVFIR